MLKLIWGKWKPKSVYIVDVNFNVWGKRGELPQEVLSYYSKFPFWEMHIGDTLHNENTFMMKITEKTAIVVRMDDPHVSRLSAINLKGRINALSQFYTLDKQVKVKKKSKLNELGERMERMW
ncbi:MAG: hypothetical protein QXS27_06950 [Candidatus Jordarchaeaceae archaeon]